MNDFTFIDLPQLSLNDTRLVIEALDEYAATRRDTLDRADGSPGHPKFPPSIVSSMVRQQREAEYLSNRLRSRMPHG